MEARLELQVLFEKLLDSRNVFYQTPESVKMKYPAIVYSLHDFDIKHASNQIYKQSPYYEVILIDSNPESEFVEKILRIPYCRFTTHYKADNLNHFVFNIYNVKGGLSNETCLG